MAKRLDAIFSQGARRGHLDGQARVGQYVMGEEYLPSIEAAADARSDYRHKVETFAFADGYRTGYRIAAGGSFLPAMYTDCPLPEECD